jgi:uncharacterized protein YciI
VSCASAPRGPAHEHTFVFLRSNPDAPLRTKEQIEETQRGHMANIQRLAAERRLLVAGPFGRDNPEPRLRGLFVMATGDVAEAQRLVATDPAVQAGALVPEVVPLATSSDLLAALERHEQADARRKLDPASEPGNGMRSYVILFAKDGPRARRALESVRSDDRVVLDGDFGGSRKGEALFVLGAKDAL